MWKRVTFEGKNVRILDVKLEISHFLSIRSITKYNLMFFYWKFIHKHITNYL